MILRSIVTLLVASALLHAEGEGSSFLLHAGARQNAMGEVGAALADDIYTVSYNPAGLGKLRSRDGTLAAALSFEQLIPAITHGSGFYHIEAVGWHKPAFDNRGSFGWAYQYLSNSKDTLIIGPQKEHAFTLAYGLDPSREHNGKHSIGAAFKFLVSLDGKNQVSDYVHTSGVLFDLGYNLSITRNMRFGVQLANMGPRFHGNRAVPFTTNLAISYARDLNEKSGFPLRIASEFRLEREFVHEHINDGHSLDVTADPFYKAIITDPSSKTFKENIEAIVYHAGAEVTYRNMISARLGIIEDWLYYRDEAHAGLGVDLFNHIRVDGSVIWGILRSDADARRGQYGLTLTGYDLF